MVQDNMQEKGKRKRFFFFFFFFRFELLEALLIVSVCVGLRHFALRLSPGPILPGVICCIPDVLAEEGRKAVEEKWWMEKE